MNIGGLDCLVMIANLCLHTMSHVSISSSTIGSWVTLKEEGYDAEILLGSDSFITPDWRKMYTACTETACVWYFKHCQTDTAKPECVYHFSRPGASQNEQVRIIARNQLGIEQAENDIAVLAASSGGTYEVPIRAFTRTSDSPSPPFCPRGLPERACWPSQGQ